MATVTHAVSTPSTSNTTTYTSDAFTPAVGDLLVVLTTATASVAAGSVTNSAGTTFTRITTALRVTSSTTLYAFVADNFVSSATSQTCTMDVTGDASTGCAIAVYRVSGMTFTGAAAVRQSGVQNNIPAGNTPSVTLGSPVLTSNPVLGCVSNGDNGLAPTVPTGWTLGANVGFNAPGTGFHSSFISSGETRTTIPWNSVISNAQHGTIVMELDASASASLIPRPQINRHLIIR